MYTKTEVTLVDWTHCPESLMFLLWHQSRSNKGLLSVAEIEAERSKDDQCYTLTPEKFDHDFLKGLTKSIPVRPDHIITFNDIVVNLFKEIIASNIPVSEAIKFTFVLEGMPVYLREQIVRDRDGSYWSMTSRARNIDKFADNEWVYLSESCDKNIKAADIIAQTLRHVQDSMNELKDMGIHQDDFRGLLPLMYAHNMSMTFNCRDLIDLIRTRSCWVVQANIWGPLISQMMDEIQKKCSPNFANMALPQCFRGGKFSGCAYPSDLQLRYSNRDPAPPCPLQMKEARKTLKDMEPNESKSKQFCSLCELYSKVWSIPADELKSMGRVLD